MSVPPQGKGQLPLSLKFPETTCVSGDGCSRKKHRDQSLWEHPRSHWVGTEGGHWSWKKQQVVWRGGCPGGLPEGSGHCWGQPRPPTCPQAVAPLSMGPSGLGRTAEGTPAVPSPGAGRAPAPQSLALHEPLSLCGFRWCCQVRPFCCQQTGHGSLLAVTSLAHRKSHPAYREATPGWRGVCKVGSADAAWDELGPHPLGPQLPCSVPVGHHPEAPPGSSCTPCHLPT